MSRPLLSGFCGYPNIAQANGYNPHERCRLEGCTCKCHRPRPPQDTPPAPEGEAGPAGLLDPHAWPADQQQILARELAKAAERVSADAILDATGTIPEAGKPAAVQAVEVLEALDLTDDEKRRLMAAHLELRPEKMLETVRTIIAERSNA